MGRLGRLESLKFPRDSRAGSFGSIRIPEFPRVSGVGSFGSIRIPEVSQGFQEWIVWVD